MGKINGCLKSVFVSFNIVLAIIWGLNISMAVWVIIFYQNHSIENPIVGWVWVLNVGIFSISCLGIYAGFSEKVLALKIFAGFMYLGMLIMLIFGIIWVVFRTQVKESFENASHDFIQEHMKHKDLEALHDHLQIFYQCCGLRGAEDWNEPIPDSCECRNSSACKPKPVEYSGPSMIYSKPCGDIFFKPYDFSFKLLMAFYFGLCVAAMFGLVLSLLMIRQLLRQDDAGGPTTVTEVSSASDV